MNEIWNPVMGMENYEVSSLGQVRSLDQWARVRGDGARLVKGRVLKPFWASNNGNRQGRLMVQLGRGNRFGVAELVLTAFVGPRPRGMLALHHDDVKTNNALSNLYWGTFSDNRFDAIRNGLDPAVNRAHCLNCGHELVRRPDGRQRECPVCSAESKRRYKERKGAL